MKGTDTCFYMNITREENSAFISPSSKDEKLNLNFKEKIGKSADHTPTDGDPSVFQTAIAGVGKYIVLYSYGCSIHLSIRSS